METSQNLSTWTAGTEIYGLGHEHVIPLLEVAAPPPLPPPDPSDPPLSIVPYTSISLKIQPATGSAGGVILSWPSLDHGGPMIHRIDGTLHQGWEQALLFTEKYDNIYFFIHHPNAPTAPPAQNPTLGTKDSEMVTTFETHLGAMNQIVAESLARARATPTPAPPAPDAHLFIRIRVDWSRDTDGDGSPDWIEESLAGNPTHPQRILANTFSSDTDNDGTADGAQLDFDQDGTVDLLDASMTDSAIYWAKGPVPRFAVFPLPNYQGPTEIEPPWQITNSTSVLYPSDVWQNGAFAGINRVGTNGAYTDPLALNANGQLLGTNNVSSAPSGSSGPPGPTSLVWWPSAADSPRPLLSTVGDVTHYASPYPGVHWLTDDGTFIASLIKKGPGEVIENLGNHFWTLPSAAEKSPGPRLRKTSPERSTAIITGVMLRPPISQRQPSPPRQEPRRSAIISPTSYPFRTVALPPSAKTY